MVVGVDSYQVLSVARAWPRYRDAKLTGDLLALDGVNIVQHDVASGHVVAVTTAAVQLAEILDVETRHLEGTAAVLLEHLVLGLEGTAAGDGSGLPVSLLLDGEGVLADGAPPDVGQGAGPEAVDTLDLVGADNHVGEASTVLDLEDGIAVAALLLTGTGNATVVLNHTTVK